MGATDHMRPHGHRLHRRAPAGFTLVELLITMAVAAILLGLAAPAMRDFIVKNHIAGVSNEFAGAILAARAEAVRQNRCVSMCVSTDTQAAEPSCDKKETDWQKGWIVFVNKSCTASSPADAADILQARSADQGSYVMTSRKGNSLLTFTALGHAGLDDAGSFNLVYGGDEGYRFNRSIVLDAQGRTRVVAYKKDTDE